MDGIPREYPLRVLHVGPLPPPWTGIGVFLLNFMASLPIRGQSNWVINTSQETLPGAPNRPKWPTPARMIHHVRLAAQIVRKIKRYKIQVVHLNGSSHDLSFWGNWVSVLAAKLTGASVVWHLHEDLDVALLPGKTWLRRTAFALSARTADMIVVLTEKDRQLLLDLIPAAKSAVLSPTCDPSLFELGLPKEEGQIHVLYVGWLTQAKGIYDLLQVAIDMPEVVFDVLGTGMSMAETNAIHLFVDQHGLRSRVNLHGVLTGKAKQMMFARAHVFMVPTHWDAFPVAVLEAMAAGLPILGTRVGGLPIMLENGRGAFLVDVGSTSQMSGYLTRLSKDADLRYEMGKVNRERCRALYHPDKVGQHALDLYLRLVRRH